MILPRLFVNFVSFCKIRVHPCSSVVKFLLAVCLLFLSGSLLAAPAPKLAPDSRDEESLIKVLQSNASPHDKDAACARLKLIGTVKSIPALAALLTDEQLSHSARYAARPRPTCIRRPGPDLL